MNTPSNGPERAVERPWASAAVRHVLEAMSDGFLALDSHGTILYANQAALALHQKPYVGFVGRNYWREFPEECTDNLRKAVDDAARTQEVQRYETEADLGARVIDVTVVPAVESVHLYFRDVTDRVLAQREIQRRAERQRLLVEVLDATQGLSDPREIVRRALHVVGTSLKVSRCSYGIANVPEDRLQILDEYVDGVPTIVGEFRLSDFGPEVVAELSKGQPIHIEDIREHPVTSPSRDVFDALQVRSGLTVPLVRNGELVAVFGVNEVHPRQWLDQEVEMVVEVASRLWNAIEWARDLDRLKRSEARFRAAVGAVGVLWTNNAEGRMTGEQPGWASLTGQSRQDYEGHGWATAVHPEDAQPTLDAWGQAVSEKRPFAFEHRVRTVDGTYQPFSIRAVPVVNSEGKIEEWVGVHSPLG
jgi:PAS domain S-box-containing protein